MRHFLVVAMVAVWGFGARADSEGATAAKAWRKVVEGFAKALVDGDRAGVEAAMTGKSYVRRFDSHDFEPVAPLIERAGKATLVGQHGYHHPPLVMAADVAADFKNATAVPEKVRTQFMIDDPAEIKRANATAVQWVVEQLEARQGQPVAVIVLWAKKVEDAKEEGKKDQKPVFEPVFVLVRGEEVEAQKFRINYVVYGNPLPENP